MEEDKIRYETQGKNAEKELRALKSAMKTFLEFYDISISYPGEILVKNLTFKDIYNKSTPIESIGIYPRIEPINRIDFVKASPEGYVKEIRHNSTRIMIDELEYTVCLR